ncbi:hypothetical protein [Streptomyces sp. SYSU K217416]
MRENRLPVAVGEFARYLADLMALLDQGGGWCGVFWQRDPDGMRASLDGREVPPWDVVESLLQDLAGLHGGPFAEHESVRAGRLHAAAVAAHDQLPGEAVALKDRLDAVLHERAQAEERQRELAARLRVSAAGPEAESVAHELAWAQDDVERATARCAEFRARCEALAPGPGTPGRPVAPESWFRAPAGPGGARQAAAGPAGPGHPAAVPADEAAPHRAAPGRRPAAPEPAPDPAGTQPPARWAANHQAGPAPYGSAHGAEGPGGPAPGHAPSAPEERSAQHTARRAEDGEGPGGRASAPPAPERYGAQHAESSAALASDGTAGRKAWWAEDRDGQDGPAHGQAQSASAPSTAQPTSRRAAHAPQGDVSGHTARWAESVEDPGGPAPAPPAPAPGGARRTARWAVGAEDPGGPASAPAAPEPGGAQHASPAPAPAPAPARKRPRRGRGARFAGLDDAVEAQVAPDLPGPVTPRGARYSGLGDDSRPGRAEAGPEPDAAEARAAEAAVAAVVAELIGLRAEGRSGEAHAVLCQAAVWPPARLPVLAAELHRAGLAADWATLLWEAASLPPDRLAATAAALAAAGRDTDCGQLLRQGVSRPAAEIADAALALSGAGREPEARALLDAFIRVRTPEETARIAQSDPRLAPQLLAAAAAVSDSCRRDLLHALRVAGLGIE